MANSLAETREQRTTTLGTRTDATRGPRTARAESRAGEGRTHVYASLPWIVAALVAATVVGVLQVTSRAPLAWDEAVRVDHAEALNLALRAHNWSGAWTWVNQQTFYPFIGPTLNAAVLLVTGNPVTAAWVPSLVAYALLGILAGGLAGELAGGVVAAWLAAILTWLIPLEARLAAGAFLEPLGGCVLLLFLVLLVRAQRDRSLAFSILTGVVAGTAWFIKYDYGVLIAATLIGTACISLIVERTLKTLSHYAVSVLCLVAVVGAWVLFDFHAKLAGLVAFIGQGVPGTTSRPDFGFYLRALWSSNEVGLSKLTAVLFIAGFVWALYRWRNQRPLTGLIVAVIVWYLLYSLTGSGISRYARYMGPVLPALAVLTGVALSDLWSRLRMLRLRPVLARPVVIGTTVAAVLLLSWQLYAQVSGPSGLRGPFYFIAEDSPASQALTIAKRSLRDENGPVLMLGQTNELSPYALDLAWTEQRGRATPSVDTVPEASPAERQQLLVQEIEDQGIDRVVGIDVQPGSRLDTSDSRANFPGQPDYLRLATQLEQDGLLSQVSNTSIPGQGVSVLIWDVNRELADAERPHCVQAGLAATPAVLSPSGTAVKLRASSEGCSGGAEYRFTVQMPNGVWTVIRDYGTGDTDTWRTTGLAPGTYALAVTVRSLGSGLDREQTAYLGYTVG